MRRRNTECEWCQGLNKLTVHHIRPRFAGGLDQQSNRITLCLPCHALAERWSFDALSKKQPAIAEGMRRSSLELSTTKDEARKGLLLSVMQTGWNLLSDVKVDWLAQLQTFQKRRYKLEAIDETPPSRTWIAAPVWWTDG